MNIIIFILYCVTLTPVLPQYVAYYKAVNAMPNQIDALSDIRTLCSRDIMEKRNGIYRPVPHLNSNLSLEIQIVPLSDAIPDRVLCTYDTYNEKTRKRDSDYEAMSIVRAHLSPFTIIQVNLDDSSAPIFTRVPYIIKDCTLFKYIVLTKEDCYYIDYVNEEFLTLKRGVNDW